MFAQTLRSDLYSSTADRSSAAQHSSRIERANRRSEDVPHAAKTQTASIKNLVVALSPSEPHRDVAMRTQLLARDTTVSRMVLLTPHSAKWQRLGQNISALRRRLSALGTAVSARILRASFPAHRTRVETPARVEDVVRHANKSDLVVVGRRRTFPWFFAPLGRYARRLLRRTRTPVLIVGSAAKDSYRHVVIATDLQTDVGPALTSTRQIAPRASITLLHVYRGFFEGKLQSAGVPDAGIVKHRIAAQQKAVLGMTAMLRRQRSQGLRRALVIHGSPVHDIVRRARELGADLIVVVKSTHSWWAEMLGASVSAEIATHADRDVLVVHDGSSATVEASREERERPAQVV